MIIPLAVGEPLGLQGLGPLEVETGALQLRLGGAYLSLGGTYGGAVMIDTGLQMGGLRSALGHSGAGAIAARDIRGGLQREQQVSGLDQLIVPHMYLGDGSRHPGADRGDIGAQIGIIRAFPMARLQPPVAPRN